MEAALGGGKTAVHRRGEEAEEPAHARSSRLQVQAEEKAQGREGEGLATAGLQR